MDFSEAEARFRELQQRHQRGERMNPAAYEEQLKQLAVCHEGVWWEIDPQTSRWMYFDGARWLEGAPPGRTTSLVSAVPGSPSRSKPTLAEQRSTQPSTRLGLTGNKPLPTLAPPREKRISLGYGRRTRQNERGRIAVPLMIGGMILLFCIIVFLGGRFLLGAVTPPSTPLGTRLTFPTSTPQPTMVRMPTPAPTPIPVLAQVIESRVNVRLGASLNDRIVDRVQKGDRITLIGRNADGTWYQVMIAGRTEPAWVFGETLEIASGNPNDLPIVD